MVAGVVGQLGEQFTEELVDDPVPGTLMGLSEDLAYDCNRPPEESVLEVRCSSLSGQVAWVVASDRV